MQPYRIRITQSVSLSTRIGQVFSSPNLQVVASKAKGRQIRRSHSATSVGLPEHSPLSPLQLPSLKTYDQDGIPWSVALNESLRLSQFPIPPRPPTAKISRPSLKVQAATKKATVNTRSNEDSQGEGSPTPSTVVHIRVQEPTALTTPRQSGSLKLRIQDDPVPTTHNMGKSIEASDEDEPRRSVHLQSMRISHHLRSGSLLSWDTKMNDPELPSPSSAFRDCSFSDLSRKSGSQQQSSRHKRQTSSSQFGSSQVPST